MTWIDEALAAWLARWVSLVTRHARPVAILLLGITLVFGAYALTRLGINSDNVSLISDDVPSQRAQKEFSQLFPILDNAIIVVIDGDTPAQARDAVDALARRLREETGSFRDVFEPGGGAFFERNGLLYRSTEDLEEFADQMLSAQPIIAELERDGSIANLASLVILGLEQARSGTVDPEQWSGVLDRVGQATVSVYAEVPVFVSWEDFFLRGSALEVNSRQVLMVDPILDYDALLPAGAPIAHIRQIAEDLEINPERGVRLRITGNPALNHEEMYGLAWDIGVAGIFCFLLVALVIYRALRSIALVVGVLVTLLSGLLWTAAFAAAAVGHVNLVSICFAILFIGLGVDFGIHLGMQYALLRREGATHEDALDRASRGVGTSLVLCAGTTSIGFYVFIPTDFLGVAELGLISGTGMFVMLFMTLTLFPALITAWFRFDPERAKPKDLRLTGAWMGVLERRAAWVRGGALALGIAALTLVPQAEFDPDVVKMRDPETESVQAFEDLLDDNEMSSPWFANVLAPDLAAAGEIAEEFRGLEGVGIVITLNEFVPEDQEEKREILADVSMVMDVPKSETPDGAAPLDIEAQVAALRDLRDFLVAQDADRAFDESAPALSGSMRKLHGVLTEFLEEVERRGDAATALVSLEEILLGRLPRQLERLRAALEPDVLSLDMLPEELSTRMLAADGRARVQVFPSESLNQPLGIERFVETVTSVAPRATGMAVNLVTFGEVTVQSLRQALVSAVLAIATLLLLLWRRVGPMVLVLAPLLLGSILTVASMVIFGIAFNFANVIVIPLLLGMGVDSAIHLVHRARSESLHAGELMSTTTARAVFYSAVTTVVSFGSLGLSSHPGMRSLGLLLVLGMVLTLFANLVVLPSLLAWRQPDPALRAASEETP